MNDRPHLLHLDITKWGDLNLRLECPWPADDTSYTPGRPCHIFTEADPLTGRRPIAEAGCVVEQWIDLGDGIEDILSLGGEVEVTDPVFPMRMKVLWDESGPELHPWTDS